MASQSHKYIYPIWKGKTLMCVTNATNTTAVLSGEESAPSTETSKKSGRSCKLLCNPQRLPKPKAPRAKTKEMSEETLRIVKHYFHDQYVMKEKLARERKWI